METPLETAEHVRLRTLSWMSATIYKPASLNALSGGQTNFTYHAKLEKQAKGDSDHSKAVHEVLVKHGEPYMARHPSNAITTERCSVEVACLRHLHSIEATLQAPSNVKYSVRTPKCYLYDDGAKTQIQEYLEGTVDLKSILLKSCEEPLALSMKQHYHHLGRALAEYICRFHQTTSSVAQSQADEGTGLRLSALHEAVGRSREMQALKLMINYDWLLERVDQFPDILKDARDVFISLRDQGLEEVHNASAALTIIHGDLCPQNVLLRGESLRDAQETALFVVDWENAQFGVPAMDHGEMIGELYATWLYDGSGASLHVVEGYAAGLGPLPVDAAFRIATQVGVHLLSFGTLAQDKPESQIGHVAREGGDIIINADKKNQAWFKGNILGCLFMR